MSYKPFPLGVLSDTLSPEDLKEVMSNDPPIRHIENPAEMHAPVQSAEIAKLIRKTEDLQFSILSMINWIDQGMPDMAKEEGLKTLHAAK